LERKPGEEKAPVVDAPTLEDEEDDESEDDNE
jgi:hypothetical protein